MTISEVSILFNIPISTLRYYDSEGLFPNLMRVGNIRQFREADLLDLNVIECLKSAGLEIKDIKKYMLLNREGDKTLKERKAIIEEVKEKIKKESDKLNHALDVLSFKSWYYDTALTSGSEKAVISLFPENLPPDIKALYEKIKKD